MLEDLQGDLSGLARRISEIDTNLNQLVSEPAGRFRLLGRNPGARERPRREQPPGFAIRTAAYRQPDGAIPVA